MNQLQFHPKYAVYAVLGFITLLALYGSFEVIRPDERAVKVTLGTVSDQDYGPGVHWKLPFISHFSSASTEPRTNEVAIEVGEKGAVSADNQTIGLAATVAWTYDISKVHTLVTKYPNRTVLENLVNNTTYEALKAEIGKYTIFDLAKNAGKIANDAKSSAITKLKDYPVLVTQVNLTNWDWSDDFDAQIKATMNTTQKVAQAKAEADRVEQEQRAKSIIAEAAARATVATAEGNLKAAELNAQARRAQGAGENDYNKLIAENMHIEVKLRELAIDRIRAGRWDGRQVSQYIPLTAAGAVVTLDGNR